MRAKAVATSTPAVKRSPRRRLATIAGVVVVLCLLGGGLAIYLDNHPDASSGDAQKAAETFLTDLKNQDYPAVYALLCDSTQKSYNSPDNLAAKLGTLKLDSYKINSVSVFNNNNVRDSGAHVKADLTWSGASATQAAPPAHPDLLMTKTGSTWQVCAYPLPT